MSAMAVPRETFGGLLESGETPAKAVERLERRPDYAAVIGTDDGQRLLEASRGQTIGGPPTSIDAKRQRKAAAAAVPAGAQLAEIPLELIDVGANVRADPGELEEFADSIRELGVLQPVKVEPVAGGRYLLRWGQRRVLASRLAGLTTIPAIVSSTAPAAAGGRAIEQLVENLDRKDLNAIEEAVALREVLDADPKLTQAELAKRLGRSAPWVSNTLRLLETDQVVQDGVRAGKISASHAKLLVVLPAKEQKELAERIEGGRLSSHNLEYELKWKLQEVSNREATAKRTEKAIPKAIAALEAAAVAKDVRVNVRGAYNLNQGPLEAAIKRAGWKLLSQGYAFPRGEASKCDCNVVTLEHDRTWKVVPGCVNDKHRDRQRNVDQLAEQERRKAIAARVDILRTRVRAALENVDVVLLLLAHGDTWALPKLVEGAAAATDHGELRDLVAAAMADRVDASRVWNDRREPIEKALEALIAMLPEPTDG